MGCLVTILFFIFFPIIYMWFQLQRGMNRFNRMEREQQERKREQQSTKDQANDDNAQYGKNKKKKHVFKQNEGEYVDFKEL